MDSDLAGANIRRLAGGSRRGGSLRGGSEVFMQDTSHLIDRWGFVLARVIAADNELRFRIIDMRAGISNQAVLALMVITVALDRDDRMSLDPGRQRDVGQREQEGVFRRHTIQAGGTPRNSFDKPK